MARRRPPSKELPINTEAKAARAISTWMLILPPAISTRASSAPETYKYANRINFT